MFRKISALLLSLLLLLPSLCSCDMMMGSGGDQPDPYTVEEQEMFSAEGVTVRVIPGEYTSDPEFHVVNTSENDYYVAIDAVVYDDFCCLLSTLGRIYAVPAGTDCPLSECKIETSFTHADDHSDVGNGSLLITVKGDGTTSTVVGGSSSNISSSLGDISSSGLNNIFSISLSSKSTTAEKREFRFSLYRMDSSDTSDSKTPSLTEENRIYRSDLILLKSSNYDETKDYKNLPTQEVLFEKDGLRIWGVLGTSTSSSVNVTISGSLSNGGSGGEADKNSSFDKDGEAKQNVASDKAGVSDQRDAEVNKFDNTKTDENGSGILSGFETGKIEMTPIYSQTSSARPNISFIVDNATGKNLRIEFSVEPGEKEKSEDGATGSESEESPAPASAGIIVLAGKAVTSSSMPWFDGYVSAVLKICVYEEDSETLLFEQTGISFAQSDLISSDSLSDKTDVGNAEKNEKIEKNEEDHVISSKDGQLNKTEKAENATKEEQLDNAVNAKK